MQFNKNRIQWNTKKTMVIAMLFSFLSISAWAQDTQVSKETTDAAMEEMDLSLSDLLNIKVVTASKREQKISDAPAMIYVITKKDIKQLVSILKLTNK